MKARQCRTGVHFTAFTAKQDLFQIFFKICLEIVFHNLEIALSFLKHETKEKSVEYETRGVSKGANEQQLLSPT